VKSERGKVDKDPWLVKKGLFAVKLKKLVNEEEEKCAWGGGEAVT